MIFFQKFYLDREKDIAVDLFLDGERLFYVIRTPNHRTGNLITNLAALCGLETSEDENGVLVIRDEIPCYIDGDNRSMYILRLGNTKIANIYPDGRVELKASIPAISKTLMSQTKDYRLDEVLLIDMDTLAIGHPVFELASMFNSFVGYSEMDHETIVGFQGFDFETGSAFWRKSLSAYLGTNCETKIREVEDKARIIGYTRMIRRSIRRKGLETAEKRAEIDHWKEELLSLLEKTDTLVFNLNELEIEAKTENLEEVQTFVDERMESAGFPMKAQMEIDVAVEEIFVNIASYAYAPDEGRAKVSVEVTADPVSVSITFVDQGMPYDPLAKEDPDISAPASEREIGGLGIYMTRKLMDDVSYEYKDGQNILTMRKNL